MKPSSDGKSLKTRPPLLDESNHVAGEGNDLGMMYFIHTDDAIEVGLMREDVGHVPSRLKGLGEIANAPGNRLLHPSLQLPVAGDSFIGRVVRGDEAHHEIADGFHEDAAVFVTNYHISANDYGGLRESIVIADSQGEMLQGRTVRVIDESAIPQARVEVVAEDVGRLPRLVGLVRPAACGVGRPGVVLGTWFVLSAG